MTFLGPPLLLFSILFADDTSVFIEGECYTGVINILNKELNSICVWLKSNKLTLNVKKITLHRTHEKNNERCNHRELKN